MQRVTGAGVTVPQMAETRRTTSATHDHRGRKRLGLRPVPVILSEREIDFLMSHNYELSPKDPQFDSGRCHSSFCG
jgi:hypothetical protein